MLIANLCTISLDEGTTKNIDIAVKDETGAAYSLDGYTVSAYLRFVDNDCAEEVVHTFSATATGNHVYLTIQPAWSVGALHGTLELRAYKEAMVLGIGIYNIDVIRYEAPFIAMPKLD